MEILCSHSPYFQYLISKDEFSTGRLYSSKVLRASLRSRLSGPRSRSAVAPRVGSRLSAGPSEPRRAPGEPGGRWGRGGPAPAARCPQGAAAAAPPAHRAPPLNPRPSLLTAMLSGLRAGTLTSACVPQSRADRPQPPPAPRDCPGPGRRR